MLEWTAAMCVNGVYEMARGKNITKATVRDKITQNVRPAVTYFETRL